MGLRLEHRVGTWYTFADAMDGHFPISPDFCPTVDEAMKLVRGSIHMPPEKREYVFRITFKPTGS